MGGRRGTRGVRGGVRGGGVVVVIREGGGVRGGGEDKSFLATTALAAASDPAGVCVWGEGGGAAAAAASAAAATTQQVRRLVLLLLANRTRCASHNVTGAGGHVGVRGPPAQRQTHVWASGRGRAGAQPGERTGEVREGGRAAVHLPPFCGPLLVWWWVPSHFDRVMALQHASPLLALPSCTLEPTIVCVCLGNKADAPPPLTCAGVVVSAVTGHGLPVACSSLLTTLYTLSLSIFAVS